MTGPIIAWLATLPVLPALFVWALQGSRQAARDAERGQSASYVNQPKG